MKKFLPVIILISILLLLLVIGIRNSFLIDKSKLSEPLSDISKVKTCDYEVYRDYVFVRELNSNYINYVVKKNRIDDLSENYIYLSGCKEGSKNEYDLIINIVENVITKKFYRIDIVNYPKIKYWERLEGGLISQPETYKFEEVRID